MRGLGEDSVETEEQDAVPGARHSLGGFDGLGLEGGASFAGLGSAGEFGAGGGSAEGGV